MQQRGILLDLLITREVDHTVDLLHTVDMVKVARDKVATIKDLTTRVHHHHHAPRPSQETNSPSWRTSESWLSLLSWPVALWFAPASRPSEPCKDKQQDSPDVSSE
jgi:hypothetical protein